MRAGNRSGEEIAFYEVTGDANPQIAAAFAAGAHPQLQVAAPDGSMNRLALNETSPGHFEARFATDQPGLYRVTAENSALQLPALGFFRESDETKPRPINLDLLTEISRVTGGRVFPTMAQLLDDKDTFVREDRPLWPYLLALALLLNLLEVAWRKGHVARFSSRFQRARPVTS